MRMSWRSLKAKYKRFKRWQREPMRYVKSEVEHRCCNCGYTFTGRYCPTCSQRADLGRIGWHSVRQSVMDIWGLGSRSRSVLYSVWQLLLRPGYFISDYISGRRQVSFPPMKMLLILAVAYAIIFHLLLPDLKGLGYGFDYHELGFTVEEGQDMANVSKPFNEWYETHFSWSMLIVSFFVIFPTWVMFRYSPRHTAHAARGVLYPGPFCRPASDPLPVDAAVQVPFQADDHSLDLFHRRDGLLHHWLHAVVWLWPVGHLVASGIRLCFCLLYFVIVGACGFLYGTYHRRTSGARVHIAGKSLHARLLYCRWSPDYGHGLPHQSHRHTQSQTTAKT